LLPGGIADHSTRATKPRGEHVGVHLPIIDHTLRVVGERELIAHVVGEMPYTVIMSLEVVLTPP
jgi:hypothetical protein